MITLKIDVTNIDKTRLYKGQKGTYLNLVLIETPNSQYSDYMIKQQVSKEDREQGIEIILGDGKNFISKPTDNQQQDNTPPPGEEGNLPF